MGDSSGSGRELVFPPGGRDHAASGGYLQPEQGALKRKPGGVPVHVGIGIGKVLFGALPCRSGTLQVDLLGALGGFGQDDDAVWKDLGEAVDDNSVVGVPALAVTKLAHPQLGEQRG